MKLTIGFTRSDRLGGYVAMIDGYREGVAQDIVEIEVEAHAYNAANWAEIVFSATNAPLSVIQADPEAYAVFRALLAVKDAHGVMRALSVGDTVAVDGRRFVCDRIGWTER